MMKINVVNSSVDETSLKPGTRLQMSISDGFTYIVVLICFATAEKDNRFEDALRLTSWEPGSANDPLTSDR
jgi:hypothetical protein